MIRTESIATFKHRVEQQAKTLAAREQAVLERERRVEQRELALKDVEAQLVEQNEDVRRQYGEFLKNRTSLDAEKVTFERQRYMWEREKANLVQTLHAQRAAAAATETAGGSRPASGTGSSVGSSAEAKETTALKMTSDERAVSRMIGGSQDGLIASRSSPSLSATDSGKWFCAVLHESANVSRRCQTYLRGDHLFRRDMHCKNAGM